MILFIILKIIIIIHNENLYFNINRLIDIKQDTYKHFFFFFSSNCIIHITIIIDIV